MKTQHYQVKSYATLVSYLDGSGIEIPEEALATEYVETCLLHYQAPWYALAVELHVGHQKAKLGVLVTGNAKRRFAWQA